MFVAGGVSDVIARDSQDGAMRNQPLSFGVTPFLLGLGLALGSACSESSDPSDCSGDSCDDKRNGATSDDDDDSDDEPSKPVKDAGRKDAGARATDSGQSSKPADSGSAPSDKSAGLPC